MKKRSVILLFCLSALLLNSCKKSSATDAVPDYAMTFKVDGVSQSAISFSASTTSNTPFLTLSGKFNTQGLLNISLNNPVVGTYTLANGTGSSGGIANIIYEEGSTTSDIYYGSDGTVTITSLTSTAVTGTFQINCSGVLYPSIKRSITEGKFNLKIYKP